MDSWSFWEDWFDERDVLDEDDEEDEPEDEFFQFYLYPHDNYGFRARWTRGCAKWDIEKEMMQKKLSYER